MTGRAIAPGSYGLDDLRVGDWWDTGRREVTAALIDGFADLSGDHFEIHMSDTAARSLGFPARVAHGLLVLSIIDGLKNMAAIELRAVASLGWDWSFRQPVFASTTVGARIIVEELRNTSNPERGIARLGFEVTDGSGGVLQKGTNTLMMLRQTA